MKRRDFIKMTGLSSIAATLPAAFNLHAAQAGFDGKLLFNLQIAGGWDVSALCDPKMNVPGEAIINNWAQSGETQTAGNIHYAQSANNAAFFDKYAQDMLVINGIDSQTNSHSAGVTHNWSGRISAGYPSLTALYAAVNAPNLPINYINNGGYAETSGLTRYTRLDNLNTITNIVNPTEVNWNPDEKWIPDEDRDLVQQLRNKQMLEKLATGTLTVREKLAVNYYKSALDNAGILDDFANELSQAGDLREDEQGTQYWSSLKRQMQFALISMKSGVTVAADLLVDGFDTHSRHDLLQTEVMAHTTDSIDFFWNYAEQLGLAERIVLVINSDFSRTPYYNDTNGKDHWPVGSAIIMERNAPWGNRMVGLTDEGQNVVPINPQTLQPQANGGSVIYPKHVMQSLREYMGVADHPLASPFAFNNEESFAFFSTVAGTPQNADPRNSVRI
jgi:hypothetical protein